MNVFSKLNRSYNNVTKRPVQMSDKVTKRLQTVMARFIEAKNTSEVFKVTWNPDTYEAEVACDLTLANYKAATEPADWELLESVAEAMKDKTVVFINPTYQGGGVAMLRPPLVHVMRLFGVDAHWFVMKGNDPEEPNPFLVTKKIHNIAQRQLDEFITEAEMDIHEEWAAKNAAVLIQQSKIAHADIIVIDDPQPAPLKQYILEVNPKVKFVWRNHIDTSHELMSQPGTPQHQVAEYVMKRHGIEGVDAVLGHPVEKFMHPGMEDKTYFGPATIDGFDDLNRNLTKKEILKGLAFINESIIEKNHELDLQDQIARIDINRPRIGLVARFDESKGMDRAMEIGVQVRRRLQTMGVEADKLPQVVIVGNGSIDDPSGEPMFNAMLELRRTKYPEEAEDIILARLVHNYRAMNALMYLNPKVPFDEAPSIVALQTSEAEGLETRITDWIKHGVPAVVTSRGGMPLQVKHGVSGFIIPDKNDGSPDLGAGVEFIVKLLTDHEAYSQMRRSTLDHYAQFNAREFSTVANAIRWLRLFRRILDNRPADKKWLVSDPDFLND